MSMVCLRISHTAINYLSIISQLKGLKNNRGCIFNLKHELIPIVITLTTTACLRYRTYAIGAKMFVKSGNMYYVFCFTGPSCSKGG